MSGQRNIFQMKEQNKTTEEELNEVEIGNLPYRKFKVMIIKMFKELRRRMNKHSENFNKNLENIKKNQTEMKKTITEIKNILKVIHSRLNDTEEWISELEDGVVKITQSEQEKEKKNEKN